MNEHNEKKTMREELEDLIKKTDKSLDELAKGLLENCQK